MAKVKTETNTEVKETKPKAKKTSKALAKVEVKKSSSIVSFEKREFHLIKDHELAALIRDHFDDDNKPSLARISQLCDWSKKEHEVCVDCDKKSSLPLKLGNERDLIVYLVHKDILEEGNWIVIVTVD